MLFSFYGLDVPQTRFSRALKMTDIILDAGGMRVDELGAAVAALYPDGEFMLLAKYHATVDDIAYVVEHLRLPVGVEWQGRFPAPDGSSFDQGHYSVITAVDMDRGLLYMADPENKNLLTKNGTLRIDTFEGRWWEIDFVPLPNDASFAAVIEMNGLMFVVVCPENAPALYDLGFRAADLDLIWDCCDVLEKDAEFYYD
jgi:hypothetical protein